MAINHWPLSERPREKLLEKGATALSDAELLAIFLRTGCNGMSAVDLARDLLATFGGLGVLLQADCESFCEGKGLGKAKFAQLQASIELARRFLLEKLGRHDVFTSPQAAKDFARLSLNHHRHEVFACLFLDSQHRLIVFEELFYGTIDGASVYPREVSRRCLQHNAAAVIFAHNHPSGVAEPSQADERITRRLQTALELLDVRVLDHLVVGDSEVVSLAERGLL
jgi:DNA repair protein RadC